MKDVAYHSVDTRRATKNKKRGIEQNKRKRKMEVNKNGFTLSYFSFTCSMPLLLAARRALTLRQTPSFKLSYSQLLQFTSYCILLHYNYSSTFVPFPLRPHGRGSLQHNTNTRRCALCSLRMARLRKKNGKLWRSGVASL